MDSQEKVTKDLVVFTDPTGTIRLKYEGGGELPQNLSGIYTSIREALNAANTYKANIKGELDAKSKVRKTV